MFRYIALVAVFLLVIFLSACQLEAGQTVAVSPPKRETKTATSTATYTITPTPYPTAPTPTPTLIPSDRMVIAMRVYNNGDYETARHEFSAILIDPVASTDEKRLSLHWRGRSELELGQFPAAITTLKTFIAQYPGDDLTRAACFNLGLAYEQNGQLKEATKIYMSCIVPTDSINTYIYERVGDIAMTVGEFDKATSAYQAGINSTSDIAFQVHLREGIATAALLQDDPSSALAQYKQILAQAKIEQYRAKILYLSGKAYLVIGDTEAAYERYLEAVNLYPKAIDSYSALVDLVEAEIPVNQFQRGLVDYYAGSYEAAIVAFEHYQNPPPIITPTMTTSTPPPYVADAVWFTALSWQAMGRYNSAIFSFRRLIDEYPANPNFGKAHLNIAKARIEQGNISQAVNNFRAFATKNPTHPLADKALWRAARLELDDDLWEEVHTNMHALATKYPTSVYASDALYWAGQAAFSFGDYEGAVKDWATLAGSYPDSDLINFADYWRGKTLLILGKEAEAKKILTETARQPTDYYSLRANDLLTGKQPHSIPLIVPSEEQLVIEQAEAEKWLGQWLGLDSSDNLSVLGPGIENDPAFQRGHALLKIGLRAEALVEFETVKEDWWDDGLAMYQLALYFQEQGLGRLSIVTAIRLIYLSPADGVLQNVPIFIQRLSYPLYFTELIFTEADDLGIDPALVLAIIRQESLFERSAESNAGASGLMQVMPTTGEYVAERSGFGSFEQKQLWYPYINIKFGAWYINQQLQIFDGNQFAAMAAYNAGPGNVLEWVNISDDFDIFVESIPFYESRLYVRSVYLNLATYRRLYGGDK